MTRQHFRDNWPLWLAGSFLILIFASLIYSHAANKLPDDPENLVIYPLLVASAEIIINIPIILLACLVIVGVWCLLRRRGFIMFGVLLLFICSAICTSLFLTYVIDYRVFHMQSVSANGSIYQLGKVLIGTDRYPPEVGFIVYECHSLGISCKPVYFSNHYYFSDDRNLDKKMAKILLIADDPAYTIYLQNGKDILYLKNTR